MGFTQTQVNNATRWSVITQVMAKLVKPISTMILARILTPEVFGIVTSISIVTSFIEMITDTGFRVYIVQHEFANEREKDQHCSVAFWTNIVISMLAWLIIAVFGEQVAEFVGCNGYGKAVVVAALALPMTSFTSVQNAIFRRQLKFKKVFYVRCATMVVPFIVTLPLALLTHDYWALIIGTLVTVLIEAVMLTIMSDWRPKWYYSFSDLFKMASFFSWTVFEAIAVWLSTWIDSLLISRYMTLYYQGIYKNSINIINSLLALITSAFMPVIFSVLSRQQNDRKRFEETFYKYQRIVAYIGFPIGAGLFVFRVFATRILLGTQWMEAADVIGVVGLSMFFSSSYTNIIGQTITAFGNPRACFLIQIMYLVFLVPSCYFAIQKGFQSLVYIRAIMWYIITAVYVVALALVCHLSVDRTIKNTIKPILITLIMMLAGIVLQTISAGFVWQMVSIIMCIVVYISGVYLFDRKYVTMIVHMLTIRRSKHKRE